MDVAPPIHHGVLQRLEDLIIGGDLKPGTRIVESDIAGQLGVSRGPVREALQALARDGFVDLRPRQGAFVHAPTAKEVRDFFEIRRALEVVAAELAAQRIEPSQAERLVDLLEAANKLLDQGTDPSADRDRDDVHIEIATIADNPMLVDMLIAMKRRSDWYSPPFDPDRRRRSWQQHKTLIDAIIAHDSELAMSMAAEHVRSARDHYLASFTGDLSAEPS